MKKKNLWLWARNNNSKVNKRIIYLMSCQIMYFKNDYILNWIDKKWIQKENTIKNILELIEDFTGCSILLWSRSYKMFTSNVPMNPYTPTEMQLPHRVALFVNTMDSRFYLMKWEGIDLLVFCITSASSADPLFPCCVYLAAFPSSMNQFPFPGTPGFCMGINVASGEYIFFCWSQV